MRRHQKIINLFDDKNVFAIKQVISIADEEDLNQLWEHITTYHAGLESHSYPFFVSLYELSERFLTTFSDIFFEIIVEQSDTYFYFTVWNKVFIDFVREHWEKRGVEHLSDDKKITVRLQKPIQNIKESRDIQRISKLIEHTDPNHPTTTIEPYTFIAKEDLRELLELADDLNTHLYEAAQTSLTSDSLIRLRSYFSMISLTLNHYEEVEEMALIISEFSMMVNQNKEDFINLTNEQITLIEGFTRNFERWLKVLFVQGGAELGFMNNSMRADMETIRAMTHPTCELSSDDLDAIFDF